MNKQSFHIGLLIFATALWGASYPVQRLGGEYVGPFAFNFLRGVVGFLVLIPVILLRLRKHPLSREQWKLTLLAAAAEGVILGCATSLQQLGIMATSVGKAGFISSLFIVIVPLASLFLGKKGGKFLWIGVAMGLCGLYFLCFKGSSSLNRGDLMCFIGALFFSAHMIVMERFSSRVDGVILSSIQFLVCGLFCGLLMTVLEAPTLEGFCKSWLPIVYAGAISFGLGATLQVYIQRVLSASTTALVMSMEAVFASLFGWIILSEAMSGREILGAGLILLSTLVVQAPALMAGRQKKA